MVHILNRFPTLILTTKTPFEAWHGVQPKVSSLRFYDYIVYTLILSLQRGKFDEKWEKFIFIGYSNESMGYHLYKILSQKS